VWFRPEQGGEHDADIGADTHGGHDLQTRHRTSLRLLYPWIERSAIPG
jgi:hypothetical protein